MRCRTPWIVCSIASNSVIMEFFQNVFTQFSAKTFMSLKGFEPATSWLETRMLQQHELEIGSLN